MAEIEDIDVVESDTSKNEVKSSFLSVIIVAMVALMLLIFFYNDIFITINSGQAGVLFKRYGEGTVTDETYTEGTYAVFPWNEMYIYEVRLQERKSSIMVLSKDGLPIKITISVRFFPSLPTLGILHKYIGPKYVENVVMPEVEATTRDIISKFDPEALYSLNREQIQKAISTKALNAVNNQKNLKGIVGKNTPKYVVFENLFIENIELPNYIVKSIEEKLDAEQESMQYEYVLQSAQKEAQRKRIEAAGIAEFQKTSGISILKWRGIEATEKLATSNNSKIIVIGTDNKLPLILNGDDAVKK